MCENYTPGMTANDMRHVNGEENCSEYVQSLRDRFFEDMMDLERLEEDHG